jgi:TetR/AcrR family transcriptional repressor of lmrAB and yxaGH operons
MASRGQSRETLLSSLREVFEAKGYDGATLTQLAAASGLGKASLYHHFPGGKQEMAAVLLRGSVAQLEQLAFARLASRLPVRERLENFIDGFSDYVRDGEGNCLVAVLAQGSVESTHGQMIAQQYAEWIGRLQATFEDAGLKPKRAGRVASDLLASLYGHLVIDKLCGRSGQFKKHLKRLKKNLPV